MDFEMRQRFEYKDGNSNKFWEIEQSGQSVTTWWGRIGTAGQSKVKDCSTPAKAKIELEKLIAENAPKEIRLSKGRKMPASDCRRAETRGCRCRIYRGAVFYQHLSFSRSLSCDQAW